MADLISLIKRAAVDAVEGEKPAGVLFGTVTSLSLIHIYMGKLAAKCTVFPDLNDKELQDSYGVMGADSLLKAMLTPGEYAGYLDKVQELNGFDLTMDEAVQQAKN